MTAKMRYPLWRGPAVNKLEPLKAFVQMAKPRCGDVKRAVSG